MRKRGRLTSADTGKDKILEDWVSRLPDDILINIISRLSLEDAARTCVLSRRWQHLWTFTTVLDFDGRKILASNPISELNGKYRSFVNKVLQIHRGSSIDKFRVCMFLWESSESEITDWVYTAFGKRVKNFELELWPWGDDKYMFPPKCYDYLKTYHGLSSICSLRSLRLVAINVTGQILEFFLQNCPSLDHLCVDSSDTLVSLKVIGSSVQLKHLYVSGCYLLKEMEISAPNLLSFKYFGRELKLHIDNAPKLVDMSILGDRMTRLMKVVGPITSYLPQLKTLRLDSCNEVYEQFLRHKVPKLTHLYLRVAALHRESLHGLTSILMACPVLQRLIVRFDDQSSRVKGKHNIPKHPHHHLKLVELHGFQGRPIDFEFALYIFENATVLEKMVIKQSSNLRFENATVLKAMSPQGVELVVR